MNIEIQESCNNCNNRFKCITQERDSKMVFVRVAFVDGRLLPDVVCFKDCTEEKKERSEQDKKYRKEGQALAHWLHLNTPSSFYYGVADYIDDEKGCIKLKRTEK